MSTITAFDRDRALGRLGSETFDVLVIGGGVTGAGVALDAAARGLRTALVERDDWASGTSSKSSKLIHGGLRYLQQKEYLLVYENLAERQRLLRNAPHLVHELPFLIPLFGKDGVVNATVAKAYSTALWLYDLTGGLRIGKRHKRISRDQALRHFPTLRGDRLVAAFLYYDAQADDARLTLSLVRTAVLDHGAVAANHIAVSGLVKEADGTVCGATLADGTTVRARTVVNAAGVWADDVRALDESTHPDSIRPAKGIHVTVPASRLPCDIAAVVPVAKDRRSIFVVPWGDQTYIGTTDTDYQGPIDDPQCNAEDVAYLLDAINVATSSNLVAADVTGTWAGLRPLVKSATTERTADLSRRHKVAISTSGVVSITGGKLTTYRKMAADTVDVLVRRIGTGPKRSRTKRLAIRGAGGTTQLREAGAADRFGVSETLLRHLIDRYGGESPRILALIDQDASLGAPLVDGLPYVKAEAVYAVREEMATTLEDILSRRTRAQLRARDATAAAAEEVATLVAPDLGWDESEAARQVAAYRAAVTHEREAADLPLTGVGAGA
ncbi:MAG: glycerol-3-phosphate dehydrogenase [Acidimicrobiales bacterium]